MPLPLKPGYNFHYSHIYRPARFEMPAAEAYTNFYGICYMLRGDNLVYSPDGSKILHAGDISFTPKNIYFRSTSMSDKPRESILIKFTDSMVSDLIKVMALSVAAYLEDLVNDFGVWNAFRNLYSDLYGSMLPFYNCDHEEYLTDNVNPEDLKFIVWQSFVK